MFNQLIDLSNTSLKEGMFTAIPAIVIKVHSGNQLRYDVQPSIQQTNQGGDEANYGAIYHVPCVMPKSVTGGLSFKISVGDSVLAIFSQRGLESWKSSSKIGINKRPNDSLMHIKDAIIIPCLFPFSLSPNNSNSNPDDTVVNCNNSEIRIEDVGGDIISTTVKDYKINAANNYSSSAIEYTVNGTKYTNNTTAYFTQDVFITGNLSVGGDLVVTGSITAGGLKVLANIDVDGIVTATNFITK